MGSREELKDKKRIVIKVGSSSLVHKKTGELNLAKIEKMVRAITDAENSGREMILVTSGAIAVGCKTLGLAKRPSNKAGKQACAAVGQASLMMLYQKLFAEYGAKAAQILITKYTMIEDESRHNARATFSELLKMRAIPIVNENDTVATDEIEFGDNDTLSAIVAALVGADLLILLSDIDGLYSDDPRSNPDAGFIDTVDVIDEKILAMGKGAGTNYGTGGMATKIAAARIATDSGADMIICNGSDVSVITSILEGKSVGTIFKAHKNRDFHLINYLKEKPKPAGKENV